MHHTAYVPAAQSALPVGTKHDQVHVIAAGEVNDGIGRVSFQDDPFDTRDPGVVQLADDLIEIFLSIVKLFPIK